MNENEKDTFLDELERFTRALESLQHYDSVNFDRAEVLALSVTFLNYAEPLLFGVSSETLGLKLWKDRRDVQKVTKLLEDFPSVRAELEERLNRLKNHTEKRREEELGRFLKRLDEDGKP